MAKYKGLLEDTQVRNRIGMDGVAYTKDLSLHNAEYVLLWLEYVAQQNDAPEVVLKFIKNYRGALEDHPLTRLTPKG